MARLTAAVVAAVSLVAVAAGPAQARRTPLPDLVVSRLAAPPATAPSGPLSLAYAISNRGRARAAASVAGFYLSADRRFDRRDKRLRTARAPKLARGATRAAKSVLTLPLLGTSMYVVVCADVARRVRELDEGNNCRASGRAIHLASPGSPSTVTPPSVTVPAPQTPSVLDATAPQTTITCNGAACAAGWYTSAPVAVTLSATDDGGSGLREIRYTTDGSDPAPLASQAYLVPFSVPATTTVKVRAYDNANNAESVGAQTIRIDTTPPAAPGVAFADLQSASRTGTTIFYRSSAASGGYALTASATDLESGIAGYGFPDAASGWSRSLDGAKATYSHGGAPADPSDPNEVHATNAAGLVSAATSYDVTPDATAPQLTIQCGAAACSGATSVTPVSVTASATDAGSGVEQLLYTTNGADPTTQNATVYTGAVEVATTKTLKFRAYDKVGNAGSVLTQVVHVQSPPPDPADIAPPLDESIATNVYDETRFLYTGADPVQTGVDPDTIKLVRAAVLRGRVLDREGDPLAGVTVTILDHAELGQTLTRADGHFDLAVNGGARLTVNYENAGYLPAQRSIDAEWQTREPIPDVVLIAVDAAVTTVDLSAPGETQVARGGTTTDSDGARQATLLFAAGTDATMTLPDGSTQPLATGHVRATEYTVGSDGPQTMPGDLPTGSAYTYAAELSIDEAQAAGATGISFDQPVPFYVENFLGFPIGTTAPAGYYDREQAKWVASEDGRVIKIVGETDGKADLDLDGDTTADDAGALTALGVTDAERTRLAVLYDTGQELWRTPVTHFSAWDINWAIAPPPNAEDPDETPPEPELGKRRGNPCGRSGSIIDCDNRTLGEALPITGTPFSLHYQSDRVPGDAARTITIPLSQHGTLPDTVTRIDLEFNVAGQHVAQSFAATDGQSTTFTWDGKDAYGRRVQGTPAIEVRVGYAYEGVYYRADYGDAHFGRFAGGITGIKGRDDLVIWQNWRGGIGAWDQRGQGLGGWSLSANDAYDPVGRTLYRGDGTRAEAAPLGAVLTTIPNAFVYGDYGVATAADGAIYIGNTVENRIRRVTANGTSTIVAGNGETCYLATDPCGDGGPATQAKLYAPVGMDVAPDGSVYFVDAGTARVRRIGPDGIITSVAGSGGYLPNPPPPGPGNAVGAKTVQLGVLRDVALGADGSLYIAEQSRVRRVDADGRMTIIAGRRCDESLHPEDGPCPTAPGWGDGGPATAAVLTEVQGIDVAADGTVYIAQAPGSAPSNDRIRSVSPAGIITTVAGTGERCADYAAACGDGLPATQAHLFGAQDVQVAPGGGFYIAELRRVRWVSPDGLITPIGGPGASPAIPAEQCLGYQPCSEGAPAVGVTLVPSQFAVAADSSIIVLEPSFGVVHRIAPSLPGLAPGERLIPTEDATEVHVFDAGGKHRRTLDALTGAIRYEFTYGAHGLASVTDASGNVTAIERNAEGDPTAIVAPGGQRTTLTTRADGFLTGVTNPAAETVALEYSTGGLLTKLTRPRGNASIFTYDAADRLVRDEDGSGAGKTLAQVAIPGGRRVTLTTDTGRVTTFDSVEDPDGTTRRTVTSASGAQTESTVGTDGALSVHYPDGSVARTLQGPDPRWGILAPTIRRLTLTTPGDRTREIKEERTVALSGADPIANLVELTDKAIVNSKTTTSTYTVASRTLTRKTPSGRESTVVLDAKGRPTQLNPGAGRTPVTVTYDASGLPTALAQGGQSWTYGYDARRRQVSRADAAGHVIAYAYDDADRPTSITLPGNQAYGLGHDLNGNLTQLTMPSAALHAMTYTAADRARRYTAPGASPYENTYDADGRRAAVQLPSGASETFTRDAGGRLSTTIDPDGTTSLTYADATTWPSGIERALGGGLTQTLGRPYAWDNQTRAAFDGPAAGTFAYRYDDEFRLAGIKLDSAAEVLLERDNDGLVTKYGPFNFARGNSGDTTSVGDGTMTTTLQYDSRGRVTGRTLKFGATEAGSYALTFDTTGRITHKVEHIGAATHTYDYAYDANGRLTAVDKDGGAAEAYGYDANANRTTPAASYDAQDRLTQLGATAYTLDADGFMTARGADTFAYSRRGELLSATVGVKTITYAYDGLGRRVARKDVANTTQFLYGDPDLPYQLTASRSPSGVLTRYFYDDGGRLLAFDRAGTRFYVATDQLGSPIVVTDTAGTIVKTLAYSGFGKLLDDSAPGVDLAIGYAGGLADADTGLVRFGARDYDPAAGRWTARDQALLRAGQANLYAYVANNPVSLQDPSGLVSVEAGAYAGAGGEGKLSITGDGISVCAAVGFGVGGGVSVDPFGDLDRTGVKALAEVSAGAGIGPLGVGASLKGTLDDCGNLLVEAKACVGPLCAKGEKDLLSGDKAFGAEVSGDELKKNLKDTFKKSGAKAEAKVAGQICLGFNW